MPGPIGSSTGAGLSVNHPEPLGANEHDGSASDLALSYGDFKAKVLGRVFKKGAAWLRVR
jgi:hypothetical protein